MAESSTKNAASGARRARLRPGLRAALDAITTAPALITHARLDVVHANELGRAVFAPVLAATPNLARFAFLDEDAAEFYPEWDLVADLVVHQLRQAASRDAHDRALHRLVGELSTRSLPFRDLWSSPRAHDCGPPRYLIRHPEAGELELMRESFAPLTAGPDLVVTVFAPDPGSATDERLRILASWHHGVASAEPAAPPSAQ